MQFETTFGEVQKLQVAIKDFKHLMSDSAQEHMDRVIKYAVAFSEVVIAFFL